MISDVPVCVLNQNFALLMLLDHGMMEIHVQALDSKSLLPRLKANGASG